LGFRQGRWHTTDPLQAGCSALLEVVCTIEGTVGYQLGRAIGGW
jgi:hypothetical protein